MLLELQRTGGATAERLSRELEVSVRTVYRDVEALGAAGVPVYAEPGPGGGIRLVEGFESRLGGLLGPEADALALAGLPAAAEQLGLGAVLAAAQAKIDDALPAELRSRSTRVRERFLLDAPGWFRDPDEVPHLPVVSEAVWSGRRLDVRYRSGGRVVRRTLGPLGLVLKAGTWYVVALAGRQGDVRVYRVARMVGAHHRDDRVARPDGFDLAAAWEASQASFARDILRIEVTARIRHPTPGKLRLAMGELAAAEALTSAGTPDADGWCTTRFPAESVEVAHSELLRLGADLEVLAPVELRERLAASGAALARHHRLVRRRPGRAVPRGR
jgi:predicted DNA-binding transcriptional regulator YafY